VRTILLGGGLENRRQESTFVGQDTAETFGSPPQNRWFKSSLCNQLFFPVNEFPAPCNHPNF